MCDETRNAKECFTNKVNMIIRVLRAIRIYYAVRAIRILCFHTFLMVVLRVMYSQHKTFIIILLE